MEPMYSPVRDETASAWEPAAPVERGERPWAYVPETEPVPPAFAPGALDMLRERVARMRETMTPPPVLQDEWQDDSRFGEPHEEEDALPEVAPTGLTAELAAIRAALDRLGGEGHAMLLATAVAALGRKLDLLNAKALDPVALRRLELQTAELRAAVDRALRLHDAADTRAMAQAQERMERDMDELRARLHRLSEEIGTLPEEFASALADQVDILLDRIEGGAGVEASALSPLVDVIERHLVALTERVVASQQRLDRLDGIEEALHRISDQMEDLQHASADVSAEAVQAVALRLSARDDAPAVVGLKRGLAALEARQREFELRTEDFLVREVELELQGLADLEMVRPPRRHEGGPRLSAADMLPPTIDLDRRIFDAALGDDHVVRERAASVDWLAAAARAEVLEEKPRKERGKGPLFLAGRVAVVAAAVGLAGVTVLQVARPSASYARPGPGGAAMAAKPMTAAPVQAPDVASLPLPNVPAALRTAALAGDPAAAYEVGVRFADGRGMEANQTAAMKWLAFATARGSVPAAYRLGSIYEYADRNSTDARRLYAWAAERGNLRAMHNLGVMATEGVDGRPDWAAAIKWFRQAAELGLRDSQHNLGVIYARGLSGPTDFVEAFKWFAVAAAQGDTDSGRKRDEVVRRSDETTMNRARAMAAAFVPGQADKTANSVQPKPEWDAATPVEAAAAPRATSGT